MGKYSINFKPRDFECIGQDFSSSFTTLGQINTFILCLRYFSHKIDVYSIVYFKLMQNRIYELISITHIFYLTILYVYIYTYIHSIARI